MLPTRDLVIQVRETFEVLGKGCGLKVHLIISPSTLVYDSTRSGLLRDSILLPMNKPNW